VDAAGAANAGPAMVSMGAAMRAAAMVARRSVRVTTGLFLQSTWSPVHSDGPVTRRAENLRRNRRQLKRHRRGFRAMSWGLQDAHAIGHGPP
jgi:hypothetical protein